MESKPKTFDVANPDNAPYFTPKSKAELIKDRQRQRREAARTTITPMQRLRS